MSRVHASERDESALEWIAKAIQISNEVERLCKTKAIPKAYRVTIGYPMVHAADRMVEYLYAAHEFYPSTEYNVQKRKEYMTLAVGCCKNVLRYLQKANDQCSQLSVNWYENLIAELFAEVDSIRKARKGVKLIRKG